MHHHGWANSSDTQPNIPKLHFVSHLTLRDTRGGNQGHLTECWRSDTHGRSTISR